MGNTNKRISIHEPLQKIPVFSVPYEENGPESTQKDATNLMKKKRCQTKAKNYIITGTDRFHDLKVHVRQTDPLVILTWKVPCNGDMVKNIRLRNATYVQKAELELSAKNREYVLFSKLYDQMEEPRDIWVGPPEVPLPLLQLWNYKLHVRVTMHRDHLLPYYAGQSWLEADYLHCTQELRRWLSTEVELEVPEYYMRIKDGVITLVEDCPEDAFDQGPKDATPEEEAEAESEEEYSDDFESDDYESEDEPPVAAPKEESEKVEEKEEEKEEPKEEEQELPMQVKENYITCEESEFTDPEDLGEKETAETIPVKAKQD